MSGAKLRELPPNDTLSLRDVAPRNSFVAVRTRDGKAGWVGELFLRDLHGVTAPINTIETTANGSAFVSIDPTWEKDSVVSVSIKVKGGSQTCKPAGDGTDDGTNVRKNRADIPTHSFLVDLDAIRRLPDTALWKYTKRTWMASDSSLVIPYEGIPVTAEGYFRAVKPQATSKPTNGKTVGEAPNCHSWAEADTDWHIALVASPTENEERAVVVEPTPRTKRRNPGWTVQAAKSLVLAEGSPSQKVRVSGFLMLDPVHPTHIRGGCASHPNCHAKKFFRATLWEIHPVTRIEVLRTGTWVNLNDLPIP
jgi:hypothetical protein